MFGKRIFEQTLIVENSDATAPLNVIFEPWADERDLAPKASLRVVARSPLPGELHLLCEPNRLVVMAWGGCILKVFDSASGQELDQISATIPSP